MARQLNGEGRRYKLYYLTRSPGDTAFREEAERRPRTRWQRS